MALAGALGSAAEGLLRVIFCRCDSVRDESAHPPIADELAHRTKRSDVPNAKKASVEIDTDALFTPPSNMARSLKLFAMDDKREIVGNA
jgi:hypothetical protein